jgi:alcohol dehydrogenase (cytochrome c)
MYNGNYSSTRFSGLSDITPKNVTGLRQICSYELPEKVMFESGLVAVGGTLYFTTFENTYAIDAATCAERWHAQHKLPVVPGVGTTRGVAIEGNRLFRGAADGYVMAYDVATGKELWATKLTAADSDENISASPIAWNGLVYIGTAGADAAPDRQRNQRGKLAERNPPCGRFHLDQLHPRSRFRRAVRASRKPCSGFRGGLPTRRQPVFRIGGGAGC